MRSLAATPRQILVKLRLPTAVPYIFSALKVALVYSLVGAIVGEFIGANQGLGFLIVKGDATFDTELVFVSLGLLSLIGFVLFALVGLFQRRVMCRYPAEQSHLSTFTL